MQDNDIDGSGGAASGGVTAPQTVADVLDAAADLLEKPGAWTQGAYARGKTGRKVTTRRAAVCFCAIGAMSVAAGCDPAVEGEPWEADVALRKAIGDTQIADWNDTPGRTQDEVVAALRAAATSARQGESHDR